MPKPLAALGEVFRNLFKKSATHGYPHKKAPVNDKFRARIKFTPDSCVGCQMCVRNCPAMAIKIKHLNPQDKPTTGPDGKPVLPKRHFGCDIDLTRCIFCAQCVDSCFKKSLVATQDFELASTDKTKLTDSFAPDAAAMAPTQCSILTSCDNPPQAADDKAAKP